MISKTIHYCWFGKKKIPKIYLKYIENWKIKCKNYKFILWNEYNFPINDYVYAKEAYNLKKYAFVSDVARIYALYKYGGIYLDTDVEMIKNFEPLLNLNKIILGWESHKYEKEVIGTGCMIFPKESWICKILLDYYKNTNFVNSDGTLNEKPNTYLMKEIIFEKYGNLENDKLYENSEIIIYPFDYFTAFNFDFDKIEKTQNTYTIHHFSSSWQSLSRKIKKRLIIIKNKIKMLLWKG